MPIESICTKYKWKGLEPKILLGSKRLVFVHECLYLSLCILLSDDSDIECQIRSLYCKANMLTRNFHLYSTV